MQQIEIITEINNRSKCGHPSMVCLNSIDKMAIRLLYLMFKEHYRAEGIVDDSEDSGIH